MSTACEPSYAEDAPRAFANPYAYDDCVSSRNVHVVDYEAIRLCNGL